MSRLNVEVAGKRVWKDDPLCTILPLGGSLFMDLAVPERDGALLREDMEIAYRFDAFARLGYGMVRGKVSAVSPVVLEDADGRRSIVSVEAWRPYASRKRARSSTFGPA
ncbi:MAG: HlyD family efflux transporter periplasmic adaptor subunit [Deltaproteobacteria bacterium]|nr:HlyD family efflux transporter periplasmic adaptor subunit [Deltaproteobacteria bacterium]